MLALVEAQFLSLFHFYSRGSKAGAVVAGLMSAIWYILIAVGAVAASYYCSVAGNGLRQALAAGALFGVIYWQFIPLMLVSTGAGLDLKRLVIYPLSRAQFYVLDLILRVTSGVEVLMLIAGATVGLMRNPRLAWWAPLAFVPFIVFNLGLASGLRAVVGRLMTGRRTRELSMLGLVLLATLPQILLTSSVLRRVGLGEGWVGLAWSPWSLVAQWASGGATMSGALAMLAWTGAAGAFGWWQLQRTLRFDDVAARATPVQVEATQSLGQPAGLVARLFEWLAIIVGDPQAALVEKELRSLGRTPRFRVVFIMGFSFSLLIWLPMLASTGTGTRSAPPGNFLALMVGYALLLLGESCFWNTLGFDRGAAQFYFLAPMPFAAVLKAKNLAAAIVVGLELLSITAVALVLRMPVTVQRFAEAAGVCFVMTLFLLAAGNLGSVYAPRAADPSDVWRKSSAGKTQALAVLASPLLAAPVLLAYLARYAFDSEWAFWGVMAVMALIAAVAYAVALDSAAGVAVARKESITGTLSAGSGPISS